MEIIKPKKLQKGDTIGIVSPSAYIDESFKPQFKKGVEFLESLGLRVKITKNVFKRYYYSAGTVAERVSDIHEMFADSEVKAIIQSQGGYTANELLESLDWELIRGNPKIFGGMSDGTTLLLSIFAKTGLVTLHGPDLLWGYGREASEYESDNLKNILFEGKAFKVKPDPGHKVAADSVNSSKLWKVWRGGVATGKLLGGNLSIIQRFSGTEFEPDYKGAILFLEAVNKTVEDLAPLFAWLRQSGMFAKIKGVVLGYFCTNSARESALSNRPVGEIFLEAAKDFDFPILEIGEIGHNTPNCNLPVGAMARLDAGNLDFSIIEDFFI